MERTSASMLGSKPKDYRIKIPHMPEHIEREVARIREIKTDHDRLRDARKHLNGLLRHKPITIPRQEFKHMLVADRAGYLQNPVVVDMSDYKPDERLLMFEEQAPRRDKPHLEFGWRFSLNDPLVLPTTSSLGRAVLWQMALRAESRAKNNLMVTMREVPARVAGNTEFYRSKSHHLQYDKTQAFVFGEQDCTLHDAWVVHVHRIGTLAPDGSKMYDSGVLLVRNPEVTNLAKCEADYAMAMLAGVKTTDLQRRIE